MYLAIRLFAAALLAVCFIHAQTNTASACIKFDRGAEMALIDEAIASPQTPAENKSALKAFRAEILALRKKTESESIARHHVVTTKALNLIGKERIVWRAPDKLEVGVFKDRQMPKLAKNRLHDGAVEPACG